MVPKAVIVIFTSWNIVNYIEINHPRTVYRVDRYPRVISPKMIYSRSWSDAGCHDAF